MFDPMYCQICADKRHATSNLWQYETINNTLQSFVVEKVNPNTVDGIQLYKDTHNPHFMCGRCCRFDYNRLRSIEDSIFKNVYSICANLKDEILDEKNVHIILRNLQGHYPTYYKVVESFYNTNN